MKGFITILKDSVGKNYLGVDIDKKDIITFIDRFDSMFDKEKTDLLKSNKFKRDGYGKYHITVFPVMEIQEDFFKKFKGKECIIDFKGIGYATDNINETYFIVCESEELDIMRQDAKKSKKDYHITLGFNKKDVFNVDKSINSLI